MCIVGYIVLTLAIREVRASFTNNNKISLHLKNSRSYYSISLSIFKTFSALKMMNLHLWKCNFGSVFPSAIYLFCLAIYSHYKLPQRHFYIA